MLEWRHRLLRYHSMIVFFGGLDEDEYANQTHLCWINLHLILMLRASHFLFRTVPRQDWTASENIVFACFQTSQLLTQKFSWMFWDPFLGCFWPAQEQLAEAKKVSTDLAEKVWIAIGKLIPGIFPDDKRQLMLDFSHCLPHLHDIKYRLSDSLIHLRGFMPCL